MVTWPREGESILAAKHLLRPEARGKEGEGGGGYGQPHLYADEEVGEMGADIAEEEGI